MISLLCNQRAAAINKSTPLLHSSHPRALHLPGNPSWETHLAGNSHGSSLPTTNQQLLRRIMERCKTISQIKQLHSHLITTGLILDSLTSTSFFSLCASLSLAAGGGLHYSNSILATAAADVFTWNSAIRGYSDTRHVDEAVYLYKRLLSETFLRPDKYTFSFVLKASSRVNCRRVWEEIHGHVIKLGLNRDLHIGNALIHCGCVRRKPEAARQVFDEMDEMKDLCSWNSMINGYVFCKRHEDSLLLFREMLRWNWIEPDEATMVGVVKSCVQLGKPELCRWISEIIDREGVEMTTKLCNVLMTMHAKSGSIEAARRLFEEMPERTMISWTAMIGGLAKSGLMFEARKLFDEMPERDIVSWNALLSGYVRHGQTRHALRLFGEMQVAQVTLNEATMSIILSLCGEIGALDMGYWIHDYIKRHDVHLNFELGTALVDMYAKCGNIQKALQVFWEIPRRNALTWTSMITGLATHGRERQAIALFSEMMDQGLLPDNVTYLAVLTACCHAGLVDKGHYYFSKMSNKHGITPKTKHYASMVNLLGNVGLLAEALELILNMAHMPDPVVLRALFYACKEHNNVAIGEVFA